MLGKTNLTTVEKGTIVSDIADYRWDAVDLSGVTNDFIKTIYGKGILAGITADGTIAYTKDGENWETKKIELDSGDYFELTDITYGDGKFVIVGWHTDQEAYIQGLVIITEDFIDYNVTQKWRSTSDYQNRKFVAVSKINSTFVICAIVVTETKLTQQKPSLSTQAAVISTDLETTAVLNYFGNNTTTVGSNDTSPSARATFDNIKASINYFIFKFAKKTNGEFVCYIKRYNNVNPTYWENIAYTSTDGIVFTRLTDTSAEKISGDAFTPLECKDNLYLNANTSSLHYELKKIIGGVDTVVMTTGIEYGFIDGAYFNKCELFINNHEMLIVRPGESIIDKTLDDMVEITYDFSLTSIVKAFDKLYMFGTDGNILVSSDEIQNEESLAVKTMSATRALYDAKIYTDEKYAELKARVAALEARVPKLSFSDKVTYILGGIYLNENHGDVFYNKQTIAESDETEIAVYSVNYEDPNIKKDFSATVIAFDDISPKVNVDYTVEVEYGIKENAPSAPVDKLYTVKVIPIENGLLSNYTEASKTFTIKCSTKPN